MLLWHNNTTITAIIQKRKTARTKDRESRDPLVMAVPVVFLHSNRTQQILRHMGISAVVREVGGPKRQVDRSFVVEVL